MATQTSRSFQKTVPSRSPGATARLAWLVLGVAMGCFLLLCTLVGYGLWQFRASIRGYQAGSTLVAYAGPVSHIPANEVRPIAVQPNQRLPLREGDTVQIADSGPPDVNAFVTLWDGSTLQLYAGTQVILDHLQATLYSRQSREVVLEMPAGLAIVGVAQVGPYQQARFSVRTPDATISLELGGSYLIRAGSHTEVAVRSGRADVSTHAENPAVPVLGGQKAVVQSGEGVAVGPAQWQFVGNGDYSQDLAGWSFRSEQTEDGGTVDATSERQQQDVYGRSAWAVSLERKGGLSDRCLAILSQSIAQDLSLYQSVRLEFDLQIKYQSLPGGGAVGIDYPFIARVRYWDAEGETREYNYAFYDHTAEGAKTEYPGAGKAQPFPRYRWGHVSLELLGLNPRPVKLIELQLYASGNDYVSWVTNVSLTASLTSR